MQWRQRDVKGSAVRRGGPEAQRLVEGLLRAEVDRERRFARDAGLTRPGYRHRDLACALEGQAAAAHRAKGEELHRLAVHGEAPLPDGEVAADTAVVEDGRRLGRPPSGQPGGGKLLEAPEPGVAVAVGVVASVDGER